MMKENKREKRLCLFFASDYHFEMISLPYINESLKKNENVIIMTENNLDSSVDKVLSRINLDEEEKNKLTKIDWKNDDLNKFKERYQEDARILYKEAITRNIEKGRLMIENDYLKATQEGQYVLNDILIDFM